MRQLPPVQSLLRIQESWTLSLYNESHNWLAANISLILLSLRELVKFCVQIVKHTTHITTQGHLQLEAKEQFPLTQSMLWSPKQLPLSPKKNQRYNWLAANILWLLQVSWNKLSFVSTLSSILHITYITPQGNLYPQRSLRLSHCCGAQSSCPCAHKTCGIGWQPIFYVT